MILEASMMLQQAALPEPAMESAMPIDPSAEAARAPANAADLAAALFDDDPAPVPAASPEPLVPMPPVPMPPVPESALPRPTRALVAAPEETLLAPQTRAAASQSLASLQEAMRPKPPSGPRLLRSGGPTLEDLVRDELRGELSRWLDENLPSMVERLVRHEIEKLVSRPD